MQSVVLVLTAIGLVICILVADLTAALIARAQAQVAADAAALAAAPATMTGDSARLAAAESAAWNGATLVSCTCPADGGWRPRSAVVTVRIHASLWILPDAAITATARAVFDPTRLRR